MRFKKGDRVRVVDDFAIKAYGPRNGDEGTVTENSCAPYVKWDKGFGGDWAISEDSLELVPSATAASTFKVGDKVREAASSDLGLSEHWAGYWAKPGDARVTEFFVTGVHKRSVSYSATKGGSGPMVEPEFLELVESDWDFDPRISKYKVGDKLQCRGETGSFFTHGETYEVARANGDFFALTDDEQPSVEKAKHSATGAWIRENFRIVRPLTIEAGKFYKTRDGRKVGPMKRYLDNSFVVTFGDGNVWLTDGKAGQLNRDKSDLIAEWTSSCAAAHVDNLRDEYGPVVKPFATAGNDNGKPKFKVGDRVRYKNTRFGTATVIAMVGQDQVQVDTHGTYGICTERVDDVELISPQAPTPTTPAIVCLIKDGQPRPSTEPHVHPSRGHAGDEAARLARKYPGKEFGVYALVDTRQVAKPAYLHEWQRLAASGNLFGAANALTKLSGIDYDTAYKTAKAIRLAA